MWIKQKDSKSEFETFYTNIILLSTGRKCDCYTVVMYRSTTNGDIEGASLHVLLAMNDFAPNITLPITQEFPLL
jgi:hypothetical protein